jgi:hypothetical protein
VEKISYVLQRCVPRRNKRVNRNFNEVNAKKDVAKNRFLSAEVVCILQQFFVFI